jgi:hypothetical protein
MNAAGAGKAIQMERFEEAVIEGHSFHQIEEREAMEEPPPNEDE